jgi:hypothetical protein
MQPRLFLLNPAVALRARVNMATVTYPLDQITFDSITAGAAANVEPGMTMLLGSAPELDDRGRQRVRNPISGSVVDVGRSSLGTLDGELTVIDDSYITILHDYRVWAKIPFFDEDGEPFKDSDIGVGPIGNTLVDYPPPKANAGIGYAGTIDPVTGLVTVQFDASDSWEWDGGSSVLHTQVSNFYWGMRDGTITVGAFTDAEVTATFPAGFRWVQLEVVDWAGRSHIMHLPVYARDPDNDSSLSGFQITNWNETEYGTEIDVLVLEDIPRSTYPDGTLAMLWDDEDPPDTSPTRGHMLFIGWIQTEDAGIAPQRTGTLRDTTLHLVDVAGRLRRLPAFPQVMQFAVAGNHWYWTVWPVILYYFWYLLHWHSTALEVSDLKLGTSTLNTFKFYTLASDGGNLFDQVNSLANNVTPDHHLTCHRYGQLMLVVDPMIQYEEDRPSDNYQAFFDGDWVNIRYGYERSPRLHWLISWGLKSTNALEIFGGVFTIPTYKCQSPGAAPGQGINLLETSERITPSQTTLNIVEGNRYARLNARMGPITLETLHSKLVPGFSPAYMRWVMVVADYTINIPQRGKDIDSLRTLCHQVNWRFDYQRTGLVVTVTLTLEAETSGPAAITLIPDEEVVA